MYARKEYEGELTDGINAERYLVLKDQLDLYNKVCCFRYVTTSCTPEDVALAVPPFRSRPLDELSDTGNDAHSLFLGPPRLVNLATEGYRFPGHVVRLARDALHEALQGLPREEAAARGRRVGRGRHPGPPRLPAARRPHQEGGQRGAPIAVPRAGVEADRPRRTASAQPPRLGVPSEGVGGALPRKERGGYR